MLTRCSGADGNTSSSHLRNGHKVNAQLTDGQRLDDLAPHGGSNYGAKFPCRPHGLSSTRPSMSKSALDQAVIAKKPQQRLAISALSTGRKRVEALP